MRSWSPSGAELRMAFNITVKEVISNDKTGLLGQHSSWVRVPLSEVASVLNGAPYDSALFSNTEGFPLIRIRDVNAGTTSTFYRGEFEEIHLVKNGDLLVGMDGDFNSAFWGSQPALLNQRVCKITPNETWYSKKLLSYLLPGYLTAINEHTSAITVKHLSSKTIGEIDLPLPPLNEQTRIVEKLEELLSDLDDGVNELKAAQKKLGQYRQSLLKAAVEGELTADWRAKQKLATHSTSSSSPRRRGPSAVHAPTIKEKSLDSRLRGNDIPFVGPTEVGTTLYQSVATAVAPTTMNDETGAELLQRILKERRTRWETKQLAKYTEQNKTPPTSWKEKYPQPVNPDTTDLPKLPEGWVWASLEQLTEFITSGSRGWANYYSDQGATFIRSQNINKDWLDLSDIAFVNPPKNTEGARTRVQRNDLLLTVTGANVGKAARVDVELEEAYVSQHVSLIRPFDTRFSEFLHLFLTASAGGRGQLNKDAYGAGKPGLNLQQVGAVTVPLPSSDEIQILMEAVAIQLEAIAEQGQSNNLLFKQSAAQRKNILKAAFSGQLVPQNPNDEPASVLLERIRSERTMKIAPAKKQAAKKQLTKKAKSV